MWRGQNAHISNVKTLRACTVVRLITSLALEHGQTEQPVTAVTEWWLVLTTQHFPRMLSIKSLKPSRNQEPENERAVRPDQNSDFSGPNREMVRSHWLTDAPVPTTPTDAIANQGCPTMTHNCGTSLEWVKACLWNILTRDWIWIFVNQAF